MQPSARLAAVMVVAVSIASAATPAGARLGSGWADMPTLANALAANGVAYHGRKLAIDGGFCLGLRRYGVRTVEHEEEFHRFKCNLNGADEHLYIASVVITKNTVSRFWWRVLRIRREF